MVISQLLSGMILKVIGWLINHNHETHNQDVRLNSHRFGSRHAIFRLWSVLETAQFLGNDRVTCNVADINVEQPFPAAFAATLKAL